MDDPDDIDGPRDPDDPDDIDGLHRPGDSPEPDGTGVQAGPAGAAAHPKRSRPLGLVIAATALAILVGAAVFYTLTEDKAGSDTTPENAAADFSLEGWDRGTISLGDFKDKPLVVNFWASYCTPCRKEMPGIQAVYEDVSDEVEFLGIDYEDLDGEARRFVDDVLGHEMDVDITYPLAFDREGATGVDYGIVGLPITVFVDADGALVHKHIGELDEDELRTLLADPEIFGIKS